MRRWHRHAAWAVHPLDGGKLEKLRRLERRALASAALAGVLSGAILGGAEVVTGGRWGTFEFGLWREHWPTWAACLTLVVVVSSGEILFLYWNAIRGAGRVSSFAGLQIAGHEPGERVARALVRAALLAEAHQLCGQPFERAPLDRLLRAFLHGQGIAEPTRAAAGASHHCRHFSRVSP